jgi:hypothetical protein
LYLGTTLIFECIPESVGVRSRAYTSRPELPGITFIGYWRLKCLCAHKKRRGGDRKSKGHGVPLILGENGPLPDAPIGRGRDADLVGTEGLGDRDGAKRYRRRLLCAHNTRGGNAVSGRG